MILYGRHINGRSIVKTILYCRVSTSDQTLDHQVTQARAAGFAINEVVSDNGVSGVSTRLAERDQGKRLFDLLRRGDVLVVRWIDRLGRNYADVTDVIRQFMRRGVVIRTVINGLVFDGATKDPMQMAVRDALISFMAALSQAQAEATKEAQRAGIEHAKARDSLPRQEAVLHAPATGSGPRHADDWDVNQHDRQDDWPLTAGDLSAQGQSSMGRGRTRYMGGLVARRRSDGQEAHSEVLSPRHSEQRLSGPRCPIRPATTRTGSAKALMISACRYFHPSWVRSATKS